MASRASSKTLNKGKEVALDSDTCGEVKVGARIAKFFSSHELSSGQRPQWIHGKVSGFKLGGGKTKTKSNTTWWTLTFEPPATKQLCCNTMEVLLMLKAAQEFRIQIHTLEKNVGQHMVVQWTEEDSDLSLTQWGTDLRICMLFKYISSTQQFVLRFKCGYDKLVDATTAVQLFEESDALHSSKKVKTTRSIAIAKQEWNSNGDDEGDTRIVKDAPSSSEVENVQEAIRKALAQNLEDKIAQEVEAKRLLAEVEMKQAATIQKQRDNVLRMQQEAAAATVAATLLAQQQEEIAALKKKDEEEQAAALQKKQQDYLAAKLIAQQQDDAAALKKKDEEEQAAALQKKQEEDLAATLLAQQQDAAAALKKKDEEEYTAALQKKQQADFAATLLAQQQDDAAALKRKDEEEYAAALQKKQQYDTAATLLTQQQEYAAALEQKDEDQSEPPTMEGVQDGSLNQNMYNVDGDFNLRNPPPPPLCPMSLSNLDDPQDITKFVENLVKQQLQQRVQEVPATTASTATSDAIAPKKRKRRVSRNRVPVKVEKQGAEESDEDIDADVEFLHQSSNTARRILWQRGHNSTLPSTKAEIIKRATVANVADAFNPLYQYGFAIIEDMTEVFSPKNRCTREQRDFVNKYEADKGLDYVFEGVVKNSIVDHFVPHYDKDATWPRLQLDSATRAEYNAAYEGQLRDIIEGYEVYEGEEAPIHFNSTMQSRTKGRPLNKHMATSSPAVMKRVPGLFPSDSETSKFGNWKATQTVLTGGTNHQHPHCDNAIVNTYANLDVFPFVCIHGFGVSEFGMWLLPNPLARHYGFYHKFAAKNMLIMRGDFVHAGGPGSTNTRAHLEFFPREAAGWTRIRSFWNLKSHNKIHPTFLWQKPTYPFAFPNAADPNMDGDVVITYPPNVTRILPIPLSQKQCKKEQLVYVPESRHTKQLRRAECAKIQAQSW